MPELTLEQVRALRAGITPGEWEARPRLSASEGHRGYAVFNERRFVHVVVMPLDEDGVEGGANAQAIAALPDVLASLEAALERAEALRAGLIGVQSELEDMLRQDAPPSQDWLWQIHTNVNQTLYDTLPDADTEARTRESVRRNAGTHRLLRELGD